MQPRAQRESGKQDLFRSRLDQIIDMNHALVKLARTIDWRFLEAKAIVKHTYDLSDEGFVRSLGGESVLPALLRRGVFPTCVGV